MKDIYKLFTNEIRSNCVMYGVLFLIILFSYLSQILDPFLEHDDISFYISTVHEIQFRAIFEQRFFHGIFIYLIGKLGLSPSIVILIGVCFLFISSILVVQYLEKISDNSYSKPVKIIGILFLNLNPFLYSQSAWSAVFIAESVAMMLLITSFFLLIKDYDSKKNTILFKIIFPSILLACSFSAYQAQVFCFIALIFINFYYSFKSNKINNIKEFFIQNRYFIIITILSLFLYYLLNRIIAGRPFEVEDWRGIPIFINSFDMMALRIENIMSYIKGIKLYKYLLVVIPFVLILIKIKSFYKILTLIVFLFLAFFVNFSSEFLIGIGGVNVKFYSIHFLVALLLIVFLNEISFKKYYKYAVAGSIVFTAFLINDLFLKSQHFKFLQFSERLYIENIYKDYIGICPNLDCTIFYSGALLNHLGNRSLKYKLFKINNSSPSLAVNWVIPNYFRYYHINVNIINLNNINKNDLPENVRKFIEDANKNNLYYPNKSSLLRDKNNIYLILSK